MSANGGRPTCPKQIFHLMSQSLQLEGVDALRRILRQVHRDRILPFRPEQVGTVHLLELIDIARRLEVFLR